MVVETCVPDGNQIILRLFIAGEAPNSRIARENLRRLCERTAGSQFQVEIINVLEDPQIMLDLGIYLTPALQVIAPEPGGLVYGNLSDEEALRSLLFQNYYNE
ncbi:MAG: circadian clock KaiB family protein [Desulforhopalus sp.]